MIESDFSPRKVCNDNHPRPLLPKRRGAVPMHPADGERLT
ncbi:MAG: hypothetical protein AVDCRST_MAG56-6839 [uncultured Cytophagales bacterium]|uniref:Uncharacterized protein n=1 Tax=uncultured Cytophagales bacterium TaxID=158755 RepID=A0A6J4L569_9SPHI|nr:MAG: hypothetical protein AVDCRST_MAG56-6839 [uncultured Cytophagales bacterium]